MKTAATSTEHRLAHRLRRAAATLTGLVALSVLAGCIMLPDPRDYLMRRDQAEERISWYMVSPQRAWVNAEGRGVVLQREVQLDAEQRIQLQNPSLVPGDNLLALLARETQPGVGRMRLEEFRTRIGGWPAPFETMESGELAHGSDTLGDYFWAERRFGADTLCVLGVRRVSSAQRQVPGGRDALDIMLRNCVTGTAEAALRPLMDHSIGYVPAAMTPDGGSRMLSPLAGPTAY